MKVLICLFTALLLWSGCSNHETQSGQLGAITFEVTGKKEAQPHFERGLLLLHSFEYDDAREEFLKAQALDPDFAMAYWGEAMSYNRSFWKIQDYEKGTAALNKLAPSFEERTAKASNELEKDFIQAVDILYHSHEEKQERDTQYAAFMGELHGKYPKNHEVSTFYAIALLAAVPEGRDDAIYGKAAKIVETVLTENQQHPGALHYLIHSYDDPQHAYLALEAAKNYGKVAPDASHALHMPSHIYVALGMWEEVVAANEQSYQASLNRKEKKQLDHDARGYHAYYWLMYGYLQQGRLKEAEKMVKDMISYTKELPSVRARTYLEFMKGTFGIETGKWDAEWANGQFKTEDLNVVVQTIPLFMDGLAAYKLHNTEQMEHVISKVAVVREAAGTQLINQNLAVCGNLAAPTPDQIDIDQSTVLEWELKALAAWLEKDTATTRDWFEKAIALEEKISYSFGPPTIVKPSHELYAEWLLEINQPVEALLRFDQAMERAPKRVLSLEGKLAAAQQSGDQAMNLKLDKELKMIRKDKDLQTNI